MHRQKYDNLKQMLAENKSAYDYFSSLPEDIREKINDRNVCMQTEKEMREYAEKLITGNK